MSKKEYEEFIKKRQDSLNSSQSNINKAVESPGWTSLFSMSALK